MGDTYLERWQAELKALGLYRGRIDNKFGPMTLEASMGAIGGAEPEKPPPAGEPFELTESDDAVLGTLEPALAEVVRRAARLTNCKFKVFEGIRTMERQKDLFARGKSKTLNSRHLTGQAVDLWPLKDYDGDGDTETNHRDLKAFNEVIDAMLLAASEQGYPLTSLGRKKGWDYYHFERTWGR